MYIIITSIRDNRKENKVIKYRSYFLQKFCRSNVEKKRKQWDKARNRIKIGKLDFLYCCK